MTAILSPLRTAPLLTACALCTASPASPLGLCRSHLEAAAAELGRLTPRPALLGGAPPSAVAFRDLCQRCGSWRHGEADCPTLADVSGGTAA
jgi:hypothetical protein